MSNQKDTANVATDHDPNRTPNSAFPNLSPTNHKVIGPGTAQYNCIAWGCGEVHRWWQPGPLFYWPVDCDPDDSTFANLMNALSTVGFILCTDGTQESGFEKIAVFALSPMEYTHVARQMPFGKWTSKLGADVLIEHDNPESLNGGIYGNLVHFMKRAVSKK